MTSTKRVEYGAGPAFVNGGYQEWWRDGVRVNPPEEEA